jgi:hypothetical protein
MTEADFLGAGNRGHDSGRQCEAWFYAGMKRLLSGDAATARDDFQKCLATDRKDYDEYNFAAAELRMLESQMRGQPRLGPTRRSQRAEWGEQRPAETRHSHGPVYGAVGMRGAWRHSTFHS